MTPYNYGLPELQHFSHYAYFKNVFHPTELDAINQLWNEKKSAKAEIYGMDSENPDDYRKSKVTFLDYNITNKWIFDKIARLAAQINSERYHFDIVGIYESLQLAEYSEGDFFDWHLDFGNGFSSKRKLSLSIQLSDSDEYEGGDLQFLLGGSKTENAPREKGSVIVFPSFILHRVTKITSGKRKSIVGWISGRPYR